MDKAKNKPNILWISLEDTSPRFGCYGDSLAQTPNLDKIAKQGTTFTNAFSTSGVCAPSRASIITGMYPTFMGAHQMRTTHDNPHAPEIPTPYTVVPPTYVKTFTEYLRMDGYYCTNNFKTDYQFEAPLSAWDDSSNTAHWRNREEGQPFFSVFNPMGTHESFMFDDEDLVMPSNRGELMTDPDEVEVPPYLPDTPKTRVSIARQYDNIAESDKIVGQLLEELKEDGLEDNTIVIIWSDHGEGLPRSKRWPYDGGIRIPLIVSWPGVLDQGQMSDQMVSLIDLGPTVLSLAGIPIPYHMQGQPFIGEDVKRREHVFATRDRNGESWDRVRAVRDKKYKYIRNYHPEKAYMEWNPFCHAHPAWKELWRLNLSNQLEGSQKLFTRTTRPPEELYDCENDPYEIDNLANNSQYVTELESLRETLDNWMTEYDRFGEISEKEMAQKMWPGGIQPKTVDPLVIPVNTQLSGIEPMIEGNFDQPTAIMLYSATQGASLIYAIGEGGWKVYNGPIRLNKGENNIRVKAVRIGFQDSKEVTASFFVN